MSVPEREQVQELLFEAAVEIARLGGSDNPVYRKLAAALQQRLRPLSTTIGEIAGLYDIPPADVLDEVANAGCRLFWWEGKPHGLEGIRQLVKDWWRWDVTPEIAVDLSPEQSAQLEFAFGSAEPVAVGSVGPATLTAPPAAARPARKFSPSDTRLPNLAAEKRRHQSG